MINIATMNLCNFIVCTSIADQQIEQTKKEGQKPSLLYHEIEIYAAIVVPVADLRRLKPTRPRMAVPKSQIAAGTGTVVREVT